MTALNPSMCSFVKLECIGCDFQPACGVIHHKLPESAIR